MTNFRNFLKSGHWPTLFASFLYFDFTFAIWVLTGAMPPRWTLYELCGTILNA